MNIHSAKTELINAMKAYLAKDEFGNYAITPEQQRPVILMGPPGIGKTAIVEQVAAELDISLISYSMTHHTRQSALGLPFISKKEYGGKPYNVSEYTMSEIIASVFDMIEQTGNPEGILFLDEINCVSETLAPVMLQFLQYKVFGKHKLPGGWMIVAAGNPPEYNKSVHEFDLVTWDRLKRIDVEADYDTWREYAYQQGTHPSIMTYLEIPGNRKDFYTIENTIDGKQFVTARGWSDLSKMITLYNQLGLPISDNLMIQYIQHEEIARRFWAYYRLFHKYSEDYKIPAILDGSVSTAIKKRAADAALDERYSLIGLLIDAVTNQAKQVCLGIDFLNELLNAIKAAQAQASIAGTDLASALSQQRASYLIKLRNGKQASNLSDTKAYIYQMSAKHLEQCANTLMSSKDTVSAIKSINKYFENQVKHFKQLKATTDASLTNTFTFMEEVFGESQEMIIFVTDLSVNYYSAKYISTHGCDKYFAHNTSLFFSEQENQFIAGLDELSDALNAV